MYHLNRKQISAGKDPMGIAATALYIACLNTGEKRTQTDIARAAGITEVTLRNRYIDIKRFGSFACIRIYLSVLTFH
jgi:transcription initiation factor TFIIB